MERLLIYIWVTIAEWLKRLNRPLLEKHPMLWLQGYPVHVLFLILFVLLYLLSRQLLSVTPDSEDYFTSFFPVYLGIFLLSVWPTKSPLEQVTIDDYYFNRGQFIPSEEKSILLINAAVVLIAFALSTATNRHQGAPSFSFSIQEHNRNLLIDCLQGEYYFIKKDGKNKQEALKFAHDSIYSQLNRYFPKYDSSEVSAWFFATDSLPQNDILARYAKLFGDSTIYDNEVTIRIPNRRPYYTATYFLNEKSIADYTIYWPLLLECIITILIYSQLWGMFFASLTGFYEKSRIGKCFRAAYSIILYALLTLGLLLAIAYIKPPDPYLQSVLSVIGWLKKCLVHYIAFFNRWYIPCFLVFYTFKFIDLKKRALDDFAKPYDDTSE